MLHLRNHRWPTENGVWMNHGRYGKGWRLKTTWRWLIRFVWRRDDVPSVIDAHPRMWLFWIRKNWLHG